MLSLSYLLYLTQSVAPLNQTVGRYLYHKIPHMRILCLCINTNIDRSYAYTPSL